MIDRKKFFSGDFPGKKIESTVNGIIAGSPCFFQFVKKISPVVPFSIFSPAYFAGIKTPSPVSREIGEIIPTVFLNKNQHRRYPSFYFYFPYHFPYLHSTSPDPSFYFKYVEQFPNIKLHGFPCQFRRVMT